MCGVGVCALGSGFNFAPPFLPGVLGCVCLCACSACTPPLLAWVCGEGMSVQVFALNPPIQADVFGSVCLCTLLAWTPPILAGVSGVGV